MESSRSPILPTLAAVAALVATMIALSLSDAGWLAYLALVLTYAVVLGIAAVRGGPAFAFAIFAMVAVIAVLRLAS